MSVAVVIRAERIAAGLHVRCCALMRAAKPLMWGHDIDVPEMMLKFTLRGSSLNPVGGVSLGHAARTFKPGPSTSGFRSCGFCKVGPRDENPVTAGAGFTPNTVCVGSVRDATGFMVAAYASMI